MVQCNNFSTIAGDIEKKELDVSCNVLKEFILNLVLSRLSYVEFFVTKWDLTSNLIYAPIIGR